MYPDLGSNGDIFFFKRNRKDCATDLIKDEDAEGKGEEDAEGKGEEDAEGKGEEDAEGKGEEDAEGKKEEP